MKLQKVARVAPSKDWVRVEDSQALKLAQAVKVAKAELQAWVQANFEPEGPGLIAVASMRQGGVTVGSVFKKR
jgi:hypothetical protein